MMAPKSKFIKLGLYNAGSLKTNQDDFLAAMVRFNADIVAINETWLRPGEEACAPAAPSYRLYNAPRPTHMRAGRGGGVGFYVKHNVRVQLTKHPAANIEQMWLITRVNGYSLAIGTAYRPQWVNVDSFVDAITESVMYFSNHDFIVLLGDFNVNMLHQSNVYTGIITEFLHCVDLHQVVTQPTHTTVSSETLIDLVCTNAPIRDVSVCNITGTVGHAMVNVELTLKKAKFPPKFSFCRPIKNIHLDTFNGHVSAMLWETVSDMRCMESMVDKFDSLLLTLFDRHAPAKKIKIKHNNSLPWVTATCKRMIDLRNDAYKRYRMTGSEVHKNYYNDLKKLVKTSIYNEKRAYFNHYINSQISDSKAFWKNIRKKVLVDPSKSDTLPDCFNNPDDINNHFLNIPHACTTPISYITFYEFNRFNDSNFQFQPVSECDIANYIMSIKSNAAGCDGISRDMILLTLPCTLSIITKIVNRSLLTGIVPQQWKEALITPIPKVNNPVDFKNLRPISILPFLSKVLEKAAYTQLIKYVEANDILPPLQSGFRKNRGTLTALLDVTDNILAEQDNGRGTILTLLDFSRAFDCLNISLLLSKLTYYGFDRRTVGWFDSYLSGRSQRVKLSKDDGSCLISSSQPLNRGIPQGSILGPLLFIIYSADLSTVIRHCNYHCYADDVQLYISETPDKINTAAHKLNQDLNRIADWSTRNSLVLNPTKSKCMVLGSKWQISNILSNNPTVTMLDQTIERVNEAKNLGVVIDSQLRFESHVKSVVRNCFYRLKVMYKIRNLISEKVRIRLCESLVLSRLNYGDIVFGPRLLRKTQHLIQRVQNACCRYCFDIPPRNHVSPYLNNASMLNMESRRQLHLASMLFGIITYKTPTYLHVKLCFPPSRGTGIRSCRPPLEMQSHRTTAFRGSFRYQATKCWNNIPPPIRQLTSVYTFQKRLTSFLLEKQKDGIPELFLP